MKIVPAIPHTTDNPLVPVSARFALSRAKLPTCDEKPSGPATRPFGLRFVREPSRAAHPPLPAHRYCPVRQVMVTDDEAQPLLAATMTTIASKDGQGNPQEDWKPDLPFHDEP